LQPGSQALFSAIFNTRIKDRSMLVISRQPWFPNKLPDLENTIEDLTMAARQRHLAEGPACLLLLPMAGRVPDAPGLDALLAALGKIASTFNIEIAGAAPVQTENGHTTHGFIIAADGTTLLTSPKAMPDLIEGLPASSRVALGAPIAFKAVKTSIGQAVVLAGEDLLSPHIARGATWAGAEIILGSGLAFSDHLSAGRANAAVARAYENTGYVAVANAEWPTRHGLGGTACLHDWNGRSQCAAAGAATLFADLDIDALRRRRSQIFAVQPLHLRANLFADGYARLTAGKPVPAAPKSREDWVAEAKARLAARGPDPETLSKPLQYSALLVQTLTRIIQKTDDAADVMRKNIDDALESPARLASSPDTRLVAFGEFFTTGQGGHGYRSPITLQRIAIRLPGPELERFSDFAQKHKTYVAGAVLEIDDKFPGHVFNTAFILNDSGDLIHRYRKIQCADVWGTLPDTTPSSIYDRYLDAYGYEGLFPVVDTPIGRLGTMVCFDQAHPEVARMMTRYGAEVIIHPSSEGHGTFRKGWDAARATRAFENTAYVLSPMPGGEYFNPAHDHKPYSTQMRGFSRIIGFDGDELGVADTPGPCLLSAPVDLAALRRARADAFNNLILWDDPETYHHAYAAPVGLPNNLWGADPLQNPYKGFGPLRAALADFYKRGVFVKPDTPTEPPAPRNANPAEVRPAPAAAPAAPKTIADLERPNGDYIQI
jgi:predicted amidohydrolase